MTKDWIDYDFVLHPLPLGKKIHEGSTAADAILKCYCSDIEEEFDNSIYVFARLHQTQLVI